MRGFHRFLLSVLFYGLVAGQEVALEETAAESSAQEAPTTDSTENASAASEEAVPEQSGPLVNLLGPHLLSLQMIDESHAQIAQHTTTEALAGKKVIGLYFSADWCGPCRQFTPELVSFYNKMNQRRGKKDQFEIVWISRCRDMNSFGQYFTHMNWLAMPPEEAMGERGQLLSNKYKVKGIPSLVLLDEDGNVITTDARNKVPQDKAGIGFPWRNPVSTLYLTLFPKPLRNIVKAQVASLKQELFVRLRTLLGLKRPTLA